MAKILLVEDDPLIAEIYQRKFESSGFEVVNVVTGKAVLKAIEEDPSYDLILLDLVIPEMGGMDVLKELRTSGKYPADLKIVVFSNLSDPEDRKRAVDLGANGFMQKTEYTPTKLVAEVSRLLALFAEQSRNASGKSGASSVAKGKRILFVEDEPVFVDMFGRRLAQEGYEIVPHGSGTTAVEAAEREHFDLVITDAMLPNMTGQEVIARLKGNESDEAYPDISPFRLARGGGDGPAFANSPDVFKAFLKTQITPTELVREVNSVFEAKP
jgi:CheY-like chemotaxis protein